MICSRWVAAAPEMGCATTETTLVPAGKGTFAVKLVLLVMVAGTALTVALLIGALVWPATVVEVVEPV